MKLEIVFEQLQKQYGENFSRGAANETELVVFFANDKKITINNYDKLTADDILTMIEKIYNS